jgi:hypothetical protein
MPTTLTFAFRPEVPETRRSSLIKRMSFWEGVLAAGAIAPAVATASLARLGYARVEPEVAARVLGWIRSIPEVEEAEVASEREAEPLS